MSDVIKRLREARPDAAGPRDEVVESARAALMAEVRRGRPFRRWGRRRVLGLAAPALAAGITAVVLALNLTGGSDEPAQAAALVRLAEAAPRLLVDEAGWEVTGVGALGKDYGEVTFANGEQELALHWLPKDEFEVAVVRGIAEMEDLGTAQAADAEARLFRTPGTDDYIALWVRGPYMVEAQGSAVDKETFEAMLGALHEVGVEHWLLEVIPRHMSRLPDSATAPGGAAPSTRTALAEMSVFSRPQTEADVLPRRLSYRLNDEPCPALGHTDAYCRGKAVGQESRLLLSGLGARSAKLYAWPTGEGWVCYAWDAGAGGCTPNFAEGDLPTAMIGIDPDELGVGAPGVLVGIVPDDVVGVSVKVDGIEYSAVVGSNGFFFELPTAKCSPRSFDSIWLTFRDGQREGKRLTMGGPVRPGDPPPPKCP